MNRRFLRRLLGHRSATAGLALLVVIVLGAALAPWLSPYAPNEMTPHALVPPFTAGHPLGTDELGRDNLARLLHGARYSLVIGLGAVALAALAGTTLGAAAGYFGGWFDLLAMRVIDVLMAFPSMLLALLVAAALGGSLGNVIVAVGVVGVPVFARQMRATVLVVQAQEYVAAARALGAGHGAILWRTVLPNSLGPLLVLTTLGVASAMLEAAGLNFLGLGVSAETPEWGVMLNQAQSLADRAPWLAVQAGGAIALTVLSLNLLGDGLRDLLDPRTGGRGAGVSPAGVGADPSHTGETPVPRVAPAVTRGAHAERALPLVRPGGGRYDAPAAIGSWVRRSFECGGNREIIIIKVPARHVLQVGAGIYLVFLVLQLFSLVSNVGFMLWPGLSLLVQIALGVPVLAHGLGLVERCPIKCYGVGLAVLTGVLALAGHLGVPATGEQLAHKWRFDLNREEQRLDEDQGELKRLEIEVEYADQDLEKTDVQSAKAEAVKLATRDFKDSEKKAFATRKRQLEAKEQLARFTNRFTDWDLVVAREMNGLVLIGAFLIALGALAAGGEGAGAACAHTPVAGEPADSSPPPA